MTDILLIVVVTAVALPFGIFMGKKYPHPYFVRRRAELEEAIRQHRAAK